MKGPLLRADATLLYMGKRAESPPYATCGTEEGTRGVADAMHVSQGRPLYFLTHESFWTECQKDFCFVGAGRDCCL